MTWPFCVVVTSPAVLPAPPKPPTPNTIEASLPVLVAWMPPQMLIAPAPPPPPIDWASRPVERLPDANRSASTRADDIAPEPAVAAEAADAHDQLARGRDSAAHVHAALAAAAADRLDRDRDLVVAFALNLNPVGRTDRRADGRGDVAGIAAAAAKAADTERRDARLVVARAGDGDLAGDVEAALAAAAADRLDDNAVRSAAARPIRRIDVGNVGEQVEGNDRSSAVRTSESGPGRAHCR